MKFKQTTTIIFTADYVVSDEYGKDIAKDIEGLEKAFNEEWTSKIKSYITNKLKDDETLTVNTEIQIGDDSNADTRQTEA